MPCPYFRSLIQEQIELMTRHVPNHQRFKNIADKEKATAHFIQKYGEIFREFICDFACPESESCRNYQEHLAKQELNPIETISDDLVSRIMPKDACEHFRKFFGASKEIIRRHLNNNKWYNHIAELDAAVDNFAQEYGEILREIYCDLACPVGGCVRYDEHLKKNGYPKLGLAPKMNGNGKPNGETNMVRTDINAGKTENNAGRTEIVVPVTNGGLEVRVG